MPPRSRLPRRSVSLLLPALLLLLGAGSWAEDDAFKTQLQHYQKNKKDPSFYKRLLAWQAVARTRDARALDVLIQDFARLPDPKEQGQHLLAGLIGRYFQGPEFVQALGKWRAKNGKPEDAWIWYQTLLVQGEHEATRELVEAAQGSKNGFLRAAALAALTALKPEGLLGIATSVLDRLPKDDAQRAALLHTVAGALTAMAHQRHDPAHHALARRLMDVLDDPATPAVSRVVIARHLQRSFDVPYAFVESGPWRQVLSSVESLMEVPPLAGAEVPRLEIAGVNARGSRIVFVLDLSAGAMRETTHEDAALLEGRTGAAAEAPPPPAYRVLLLGMREALQRALERLTPEQSFAIVVNRHRATDLLPGTSGIQPATPRNISDALANMAKLVPEGDPDLHAGLRRAFALTDKGAARKEEFVDPTALLKGCDTVVVLVQAGPVRDEWVDPGSPEHDPLHYSSEGREVRGVYSDVAYLAEDLRRLNLFRKAEIHALVVGDAPRDAFRDLFAPYRGWGTLEGTEREAAGVDAAQARYSAVRRQYDAYLKRPSLFMRMRGRRLLAETLDPRALDVLADGYRSPEPPTDRVPHLLVSLAARHFDKAAHLPRFAAWRGRNAERQDAWLWFRTCQLELERGDPGIVEAIARDGRDLYLRLAAARAIAATGKPTCEPLAAHLLATLPPDTIERALVLEAAAALLQARGHARTLAPFGPPAEALIGHLRDASLPLRTRHVIVRHLARIFRTDTSHGLDADRWLRELKGAQGAKAEPPRPADVYAPFEFIGIPSAGGRVCYVVDASDSMLEPISDKERRRLARVVTGSAGPGAKDDQLPWDKIKNRFDVAREYLKLSLERLTPEKSFAVVLFGTDATPLPSTTSLVEATPAAIRKAIQDLDAIAPGPPAPDRPHGTLRGFTNLHGGLDLALRLTPALRAARDPYVEPRMLVEGVDTIFLLSDGAPSMDDYRAVDMPDAGDAQADPESGTTQEKVPDVTFYGPYVDAEGFLVEDVRRMNLFRNAAIHCVGIGEADMMLLREIAAAGLGETRTLGKEEER